MEVLLKAIKMVLVAILVVGIIISAISCSGNGEDKELQTYSGHGFSFKYPKTFGVDGDETIGGKGGFVVMVSRDDFSTGESQSFMVAGGHPAYEVTDLNQDLEYYLNAMEQTKAQVNGEYLWSPPIEIIHSGHPVIYKCYTYTWPGVFGDRTYTYYGVVATFFCDKSDRTFILQTEDTDNVTHSWAEAWEDFTIYLDSFDCH